jgi:hypothetical protein
MANKSPLFEGKAVGERGPALALSAAYQVIVPTANDPAGMSRWVIN